MKLICHFKFVFWKQQRTIANTAEFSVGGNTYKRFEVKIDRSSNITDRMSDSRVIDWKTETLFLRQLVEGRLALYQYEDSNLVKYFYSEGNHATANQLIFREYKSDGIINANNNFRQQLYSLMKDKYADNQKFKRLKYKRQELTNLFEDYDGVTAENNPAGSGRSGALHLYGAAGATFSSMSVEAAPIDYQHDFENKTGFRVGLQLEYVFPFNRNKWALLLDPNYQNYSSENTHGTSTWKTKYQRIEVPVIVRHYFYLNDKSKIFVNGAYALNFTIGDSYIKQNTAVPFDISKNSSWAFGTGFSYDKVSLEARYIFKHGLVNEGLWTTNFSSFHVLLAYRLF